jgi:hypothetical protein
MRLASVWTHICQNLYFFVLVWQVNWVVNCADLLQCERTVSALDAEALRSRLWLRKLRKRQVCRAVPLYMCPHSTVTPRTSICVPIRLWLLVPLYMCPHTTVTPRTFIYVSSYDCDFSYLYICVPIRLWLLVPLYMCPHTTVTPRTSIYVYSYDPDCGSSANEKYL